MCAAALLLPGRGGVPGVRLVGDPDTVGSRAGLEGGDRAAAAGRAGIPSAAPKICSWLTPLNEICHTSLAIISEWSASICPYFSCL